MPGFTEAVKKEAKRLGFHAVGIAPAGPLLRAEQALLGRTRQGLLKDYGFSPERARDFTHPEDLLEGAKSIVTVAISYLSEKAVVESEPGNPRGRMARFSWGRDYHIVVNEKLEKLGLWIEQRTGAKSRICVDTAPVLDRAVAQLAGMGWYGKNTSIITHEHGSWVVLGELITQAELEPDEPADFDKCGKCEVCIKSCPTGAIVAPFVIDANRCISHLTQMKGFIPRELRPYIGDTIYGCDICQQVCPQNKKALPTDSTELGEESVPGRAPELIPLLNISAEEFNRIIKPNTAGWIRRTRFRRNVAVVLGNLKDPAAVPELVKALDDPEPVVRGHAAWALGQIGTPEAKDALKKAFLTEKDEMVREEIAKSG